MNHKGRKKKQKSRGAKLGPYARYNPHEVESEIPPGYVKVDLGVQEQNPLTAKVIRDAGIGRNNALQRIGINAPRSPQVRVGLKSAQKRSAFVEAIVASPQTGPEVFVAGFRGRGVPVFTPGLETAVSLYQSDPMFRAQIASGKYAYVNGAFCLRKSAYVSLDPMKGLTVTAYAKENADECMMRFGITPNKRNGRKNGSGLIVLPNAGHPLSPRGGSYLPSTQINLPQALLHGEAISVAEIVELNGTVRKSKGLSLDEHAEISELIDGKSFGTALGIIMGRLKFTISDLAEITHIDDKKIGRLRNDEMKTISPQDVLAIIIGLHLLPPIGEKLFKAARIYLGNSKEDNFYGLIIGSMTDESIEEINKLLLHRGYSTIPKYVKPKTLKKDKKSE